MRTEITRLAHNIYNGVDLSVITLEKEINDTVDQCLATNNETARQRREELCREITFWQGKFAMVKHELSIVRKRLYKKEKKP